MEKLLTNAQMRAADEYTINTIGISSRMLMQRAGEAIALEVANIAAEISAEKITVVCGTGNNGGDGYVCAKILHERGLNVRVFAVDGKLSPDCSREKQAYSGAYSTEICGDIIVDCIFGTGLSRQVEGDFSQVIEKINKSGAFVVSADIPSGINGDNGKIMGCVVKANLTIAIAEYKLGFALGDGIDYCGTIIKKDIGIVANGDYAAVCGDDDIAKFYPARRRNTHKGSYGSANLIVGSVQYAGAAALALSSALQSGCGFVKLTCAQEVKSLLVAAYPQTIFLTSPDYESDAIAIGCGCGVSQELYGLVENALKDYTGKLIIDADGLNVLSRYGLSPLKDKKCKVLITPHVKEFSRLTGSTIEEILSDPVTKAKLFAQEYGVTVLLKGAATVITDGTKTVINTRGTTALSKGGSGDMLSGLICGNAARGLDLFDAAVASSYVLGVTAELCSKEKTDYCVTANDIVKNFHKAIKCLTA